MNKSESDLFSEKQQGTINTTLPDNDRAKEMGEEVSPMLQKNIAVNKKLELYLEKYINSFDEMHEKIELKGKLIDLIRKL